MSCPGIRQAVPGMLKYSKAIPGVGYINVYTPSVINNNVPLNRNFPEWCGSLRCFIQLIHICMQQLIWTTKSPIHSKSDISYLCGPRDSKSRNRKWRIVSTLIDIRVLRILGIKINPTWYRRVLIEGIYNIMLVLYQYHISPNRTRLTRSLYKTKCIGSNHEIMTIRNIYGCFKGKILYGYILKIEIEG